MTPEIWQTLIQAIIGGGMVAAVATLKTELRHIADGFKDHESRIRNLEGN